jgi:hypothetical protein
MNEDFGAATYQDGLRMLANGEGVHYPMRPPPLVPSRRTIQTSCRTSGSSPSRAMMPA